MVQSELRVCRVISHSHAGGKLEDSSPTKCFWSFTTKQHYSTYNWSNRGLVWWPYNHPGLLPGSRFNNTTTFKQISGALDGPLPVFSWEVLKRRGWKICHFSVNHRGHNTSVPMKRLTNTGQWFAQTVWGVGLKKKTDWIKSHTLCHRFSQVYAGAQIILHWNYLM